MFDSTALLGLFRPFRLFMGAGGARSFWAARAAELLADWVFVVALFVAVYAITADIAVVALFMLSRVLPRAVVSAGFHRSAARLGTRGLFLLSLPRIPLIASLVLLDGRSDLPWASGVVVAYGLLTAVSNEARSAIIPRVVSRSWLAAVIQLNSAIERITFVVGPLLAALLLWGWDVEVAFVASSVALAVTSVLLGISTASFEIPAASTMPVVAPAPRCDSSWSIVRHQPTLRLLAGGLFAAAALAVCLKVILVELATDPLDRSDETLGLLLALVGVGTLLGPLSVPRLLGHLPISLIVTGSIVGIAAGIVLISVVTRLEIVVLVLIGLGMISITNDMVTTTATRRLAPEADLPGAGRVMLIAVIAGQFVAAVAVALLARVWDVSNVMLAISVACGALMVGLFVMSDGHALVSRRLARP